MDKGLVGRPHRYGYSAAIGNDAGDLDTSDALVERDRTSGRSDVRSFGAGAGVGEFVLVPSGPDAGEDESVLMGLVYDSQSDCSRLELLDAETLDTTAATATSPPGSRTASTAAGSPYP